MQCASNRSGSGLLGPFLWRFGLRSAQREIAFTIKCIVLPIPRGPIHLADCALLGPDVGARILRYWENTEGIDVREYPPFFEDLRSPSASAASIELLIPVLPQNGLF